MTKQERIAEMVQRAVEIKRVIEDLSEELDGITEQLDESGLDHVVAGQYSATKVSQVKRLFSQSEAVKLLGAKAKACFYPKPVVFWKFSK
jgi:hypothetical protein